MELNLAPEITKMIEDSVKSGEYGSTEELVTVALNQFVQLQEFGDFAPGEMEALIVEGERSGPPIPYETVRAELKALHDSHLAGTK